MPSHKSGKLLDRRYPPTVESLRACRHAPIIAPLPLARRQKLSRACTVLTRAFFAAARYNRDGDLIFSTAKDQHICAWFSHNGERMGTYHGHQGAIWTVDVDPTSTVIASGSADNTIKLWEVQTGKCLMTWDFPTAVKRVEFNEDGTKLLGVTEKRMGHLGTIVVLDVNVDPAAEQNPEKVLTIVCDESKATVAGWSYISKYIIAGHEDGSVSQYDGKNGDLIYNIPVHELGMQVTDLQWSPDRTYLITASKDKTAKLISARDLEVMKTFPADTPLNSATITPKKDFVILGGGQAAMDVTTTAARQGKFEARFYHKIFEEEVGRVRGHFGPLVSLISTVPRTMTSNSHRTYQFVL